MMISLCFLSVVLFVFFPLGTDSLAGHGACFNITENITIYNLGCWHDQVDDRALPTLLINRRGKIDWDNYDKFLDKLVADCARAAFRKYRYFAIQFYGECWAGSGNYRRHGKSDSCVDGFFNPCKHDKLCTGKQLVNYVYTFEYQQPPPTLPGSRIIGGNPAAKGAWPWQALLRFNGKFRCGGSLIDDCYVLTACHCVTFCGAILPLVGFQVILGDWRRNLPDGTEQTFNVIKIIPHPWSDIALIKLDRKAVLNPFVSIIPLGQIMPPVNTSTYITGWGWTIPMTPGSLAITLQQLQLPIAAPIVCFWFGGLIIGLDEVCVGTLTFSYENLCHRDSGGPLVHKESTGWKLYGVAERGHGGCPANKDFGVYVSVPYHRTWINNQLALPGNAC